MFLGDQGRDTLIAYNILHGDFTFIGPMTSVGNFYLGPFYYYFIAPWLFIFNYSPVGPAFGIAFFSLLTILLLYYFIFKVSKSHLIAFFASLIYATNPIVVEYSRFSWNPNLLPFASLLFVYLSYRFSRSSKLKNQQIIALGITYGIILQLHYLAGLIILLPIILNFSFWKNIKKNYKAWLVLIGSVLITELPFILFEYKHDFREVKNLLSAINTTSNTGIITLDLISIIKSLSNVIRQLNNRFLIGYALFLPIALAFYSQKTKNKFAKLIFVFTFISLLSLSLYNGPLYDHYFAFAFFLPVLTLTYLYLKIKKTKRSLKLLITYSLIIISLNLIGVYQKIFKYPANNQIKTTIKAVDLIINQSQNKPFNFALLSDNNYDLGYKYFFKLKKAPLKTIHQKLTDQLFVVCEKPKDTCQPIGNSLWDVAAFGWAQINQTYAIPPLTIYKLTHYQNQ
ncbi:MAG: phospholipid carrier-dependent glycosyltransferase [bacterium]|nr:phospholipid carrier-dependent glycosyltransferase [bacterium]